MRRYRLDVWIIRLKPLVGSVLLANNYTLNHHTNITEDKVMYVGHVVYPLVLASTNIVMGLVLYYLAEPVLAALLVVIGILVMLASAGGTLKQHLPVHSDQS